MRRILGILVVAALVVAISWWAASLTGRVTILVAGLTLEAPVPVALLALLLGFVALYLVVRLLATLFGLPGAFRARGARRQRGRGDQAVTASLLALAAREPGDARREAARARRLLGDTPQTLLLAAYAGAIAGNEAEAETAFKALADNREARFLGLRGLLRQAIGRGDFVEAARLAREAERAHPGAAWLRDERTRLALRSQSWGEALLLSRQSAPRAALATAAAESETDPRAARRLAKQAFAADPALAPAAIAYARRLRQAGKERAAQAVLRQAWAASPHPDIATFAIEPAADRLAALRIATELVKPAAAHPESHLLLGRLSLAAGLTGEAHRHAEATRAGGLNQRRVHVLLADIAEAEGADAEHRAIQRDELRQAAMADPDPVWRCDACSTTHEIWHAACPNCQEPGRIRWQTPTRALIATPV